MAIDLLARMCGTARVHVGSAVASWSVHRTLQQGETTDLDDLLTPDSGLITLQLVPAAGGACARCWRMTVDDGGDVCERCRAVLQRA